MIAVTRDTWIWVFTIGSAFGLVFGSLVVLNSIRDRAVAKQLESSDRDLLLKVSDVEIRTETVRGGAQVVHFAVGVCALLGALLSFLLPAFALSSWILTIGSAWVWWTRWGNRHWRSRIRRWKGGE